MTEADDDTCADGHHFDSVCFGDREITCDDCPATITCGGCPDCEEDDDDAAECVHCGGPRGLYGHGEGCPALSNGNACEFEERDDG